MKEYEFIIEGDRECAELYEQVRKLNEESEETSNDLENKI